MHSRPWSAMTIAVVVAVCTGCAPSETPQEKFAREAAGILDQDLYAEGDDWQDAREELVAAAADADEVSDILPAVREAISVAGGEHSFLLEDASLDELGSDAAVYPSADVVSPGVVVLTVPATSAQTVAEARAYVEAGVAAREATAEEASCGWIVDVRGNLGGNMFPMLAVVAPLLDTSNPLSWTTRDGVINEVLVRDGRVEVTGDEDPYVVEFDVHSVIDKALRVVVLQDERTASSGEAVVAAFLGQRGVVAMGTPTMGLSTANSAFVLSDGSTIILTTATFVTRDGIALGGPIEPDVTTDSLGDTALAEASAQLQPSCG